MVNPAHKNAALRHVRVLELTDAIGQYAGKLMADMGADVIKIEPVTGSSIRQIGPFEHDVPDANRSLTFWHYNTSKRSITLNLETPEGREVFKRLAATADVIIESFRPGYLEALGLGYENLKADNPKLIVCAMTHFGQKGPWADFEAGDAVHLALGGTMASSGYDSVPGAPPIAPTGGNAYHTASHIATSAMLVALIHAKRTGKGQFIDMAVHDATSVTTEIAFFDWVYDKKIVKRFSGRHAGVNPSAPTNLLTRDGKRINLMLMPLTQASWEGFVAWLDETGEADDLTGEAYKSVSAARANMPHVMEVLTRFCANHDLEEIYHRGQKLRFAWSPIVSSDEVPQHPHWQDRGDIIEVEYPESGRSYQHLAGPYKFSRSHWEIRGRAPTLGEHNGEVLADELGLGKDRLAEFAAAGVI